MYFFFLTTRVVCLSCRKFKNSDVPTCLLKSVPETCVVYVISKGRIQTSRSASRPQTPRSSAVTPRSSSVTPRSSAVTPKKSSLQLQLFNHTHGVSDFEDVIRYIISILQLHSFLGG